MESKEIGPSLYDNYEQLEDRNKDKLQVIFKKYSLKKDENYFREAENGVKEKQIKDLQAENKRLVSELDKKDAEAKQAVKELNVARKELENIKAKFS